MKLLVTGASRGIGFAIAQSLSAQHDVTGCARNPPSATPLFEHITGIDFRDLSNLEALPLGDFDGLVNNVGIALDGLLATQGEELLREVLEINLTATLILTKRYVRARLARRQNGVIVNVSSIIAIRGYAGLVAYSASKAGLDGATRALARELGPKGFRINSVLPGFVETDLSSKLNRQQREQIRRRTPLGNFVQPLDIAAAVEFLISDASRSITGQSLVVDGGITV